MCLEAHVYELVGLFWSYLRVFSLCVSSSAVGFGCLPFPSKQNVSVSYMLWCFSLSRSSCLLWPRPNGCGLFLSFRAQVGTIFALSWLITWYGHVLSEFKHTLRLYDFFLASHPMMPIYLAATVRSPVYPCIRSPRRSALVSLWQIVLYREKEVKRTECDMATVHHLLSRIPQDLPYELLISQAQDLFEQYPPPLLAKQAALQSRKR